MTVKTKSGRVNVRKQGDNEDMAITFKMRSKWTRAHGFYHNLFVLFFFMFVSHFATSTPTRGRTSTVRRATMNQLAAIEDLSLGKRADPTIVDEIMFGTFGKLDEEDTTRLLYNQFGKIIDRLRNAELSVEIDLTRPAVGSIPVGDKKLTPAQLIYKDYRNTDREVDRTIVGTFAMQWVIGDKYTTFTGGQFPAIRLKDSNWKDLQARVNTWTKAPENLLGLTVALILGDVGKDRNLGADARKQGISIPEGADHDMIMYKAVEGGMFDDAMNLIKDPSLRDDIKLGIQVGAGLNIPQLAQGECPPGSLSSIALLEGSDKDRAYNLKFLEVLFDVSGAGASDGTGSALRMIDPVYQGFRASYNELQKVREKKQDLLTAYDNILDARNELLASDRKNPFRRLSVKKPDERALTRLMLAARVLNSEQATQFEKVFNSLDKDARTKLIDGLNVHGIKDGTAVLPYYMPAVFEKYFGRLKAGFTAEEQEEVLGAILRLLSRAFGNTKSGKGENRIVTVELIQFVPDNNNPDKIVIDPAKFKNDAKGLVKAFDDWKVQFPQTSGLPLEQDEASVCLV